MSVMRFSKDHEWVRLDGSEAVVGITPFAQAQLGDIVHVDLPKVGQRAEQGKEIATVESVKAANDLYAPLSGEVTDINAAVATDPAKINDDPMGGGWFFKLRVAEPKEFDALMDENAYKQFVDALAGPSP